MNINEYLQYNPETGVIIWIKNKGPKKVIGKNAGGIKPDGYVHIKFNNKTYKAHRVAWYLHYGVWPTNHIDHINGIKNDNRINNLRDVTNQQNLLNQKRHREKTVKYYYFYKKGQKWKVQTQINNKRTYFGYFETEEKALQFIQSNIHLFPGAKPFECKI
jgi:hypothetical protein